MKLTLLPNAGHDSGEDEEIATADDVEVPKDAPIIPLESASTKNPSLARRDSTVVHHRHAGRDKRKRWQANIGVTRQTTSQRGNQAQNDLMGGVVEPKIGGADPFGAFELPKHSSTDLALHHWINVFQKSRMPITPRQDWLKINLSDKTLLSVITYCSSNHYYFMRAMRPPTANLVQKVNAIHNINSTLGSGLIPNDYTMIAVAVMAMLECLAGEVSASIIHRKGLEQMVQLRGGLQNLGFEGAVQRTVSWADTSMAIVLGKEPSLRPTLMPNVGDPAMPGFTVGDLEERLLIFTSSAELSKTIIYIWLRLRYLAQFLANLPDPSSTLLDDVYFSDKLDFVERHILSILHSSALAASPVADFLTAFLNASLIYIYEELRECPRWTNVAMRLSGRIRAALQATKLSAVTSYCPDLLLWILELGRSGNSPLAPDGGEWYARVVANMEEGLEMEVPPRLSGLEYFETAERAMIMVQLSSSDAEGMGVRL